MRLKFKSHISIFFIPVLVLVLPFYSSYLFGQVNYSTHPHYLQSKSAANPLLSGFNSIYPDTGVSNLSHFYPRNFMGNVGLSSPRYIMEHGTDETGFRLYELPLDADRILHRHVQYFRSKGPFAQLTGIAGQKELQMFRMLFTHTLRQKVNISLLFNRNTSTGFYNRQQSYANNFYLSSNYTGNKKNWGYYAYLLNNGNRFQENGGISAITLSDSTRSLNKNLLTVNSFSASRQLSENKLVLNPWIKLNPGPDSIQALKHYLEWQCGISSSAFRFKDQNIYNEKNYPFYHYDSLSTNDSTHLWRYSNALVYTLKNNTGTRALSLAYHNEINRLWQKKDSLIIQHQLRGNVYCGNINPDSTARRAFENQLIAEYIIKGPMAGNYKAENTLMLYTNVKKQSGFKLAALAESRSPDYIFNTWNSNHFKWNGNGYKARQTVQLLAEFKLANTFSVAIMYHNLFNYLYFDEYALPRQYAKTVENLALSAGFNHVFFKHLGVSLSHIYQQSSHSAYIRIIPNLTTARLYYSGNLLRNNLQLQLGTQGQWYQSFTSYAYMPALQVYYLQHQQKTAATPFIDVYFNARIRPVSVFIKMENLLQRFMDTNYSFVAGYQQNDMALRFGITWLFFD